MKKLFFVAVLALLVMFGGSAAFANEAGMHGSWQIAEPCAISEEAMAAFKEATNVVGASYEALYLVGTQVVAGTNYMFIAKQTQSTNPPMTKVLKLVIYQGLDKKAVIQNESIVPLF